MTYQAKGFAVVQEVSGTVSPEISVVVPVYNEAGNVANLVQAIDAMLKKGIGKTYELILVDDGSTDGTTEKIKQLSLDFPNIVPISFVRNYGQSAAMQAGFDHAKGEIIVTMDGDLQNDPGDVPAMLKMLVDESADMVSGWRKNRHDGFVRVLFSKIANRIIGKISGLRLHDYGCSLKVYKASAIRNIRLYGELHRFIPALINEIGGKIVEMEVNHRARTSGRSKYNLDRTFRVMLDLLLVTFLRRYLHRPLHFFGGIGMAMGTLGFVICIYLSALKFVGGQDIGDRPLLLLGITLIMGGIILLSQGISAEIMVRIMHEDGARPQYRKMD